MKIYQDSCGGGLQPAVPAKAGTHITSFCFFGNSGAEITAQALTARKISWGALVE